jgi:hypothetical protein
VEELQRLLAGFSAAEDTRLQELLKISQERGRAWESVDATALSLVMSEIQRLKQQPEAIADQPCAARPAYSSRFS